MANITVTEVNDGLATIIAANALGYLQANTVLANLINRDYSPEVATHGQVVKVPFTGALSVNDKAVNTAVTLQAPADTAATVTLNKHKEVSFLIEDPARAMARPDYLATYVSDGMKKMAEQIDADIAGLWAGLSGTIDASAGLAESHFRDARRRLNAAKAPLADRVAVLHEDAEYELLAIDRFMNSDFNAAAGANPAGLVNAYSGRFMGFGVFMNQNLLVTSSLCRNLFFHKNAFVMASRSLPTDGNGRGVQQITQDEGGFNVRVTMSYNPTHLGMQVTIDALYGVAELRDNHGIAVFTTEI